MAKQYVRVELYRGFTWTVERDPDDANAAAVYARDPITISHGRGPEQGEPTPSSLALTLKGHDYNPANPASPLYGKIGLNTPIRISTGEQAPLEDNFNRSVTDSWNGGPFTWTVLSGASTAFDVAGTSGTITSTSTNFLRGAAANTGSPNHRVRVRFSLSQADIAGAAGVVEVWVRVTDINNMYRLLVNYSTTEVVTAKIWRTVAGSTTEIVAATPVAILTGAATTDMMAEVYVEGPRLYAKVWQTSGAEPLEYQISVTDTALTTGNSAGLGTWRVTGNTNSDLIARFDDFEAVPGTIRFCGEVADWRPRRDPGGDRWVEVEAGDPLRRLQAPQAPVLRSALWREILNSEPLAFWPLTDGTDALAAASALPGGPPMPLLKDGDLELRQINPWTEPILTPKTGEFLTYNGPVNQPSTDTAWAADFVFAVDQDAEDADLGFSLKGPPSGLAGLALVEWILTVEAIGTDNFITWGIIVRQSDGVTQSQTTIASGTVAVKDGRLHHARLVTDNNGANTDWELFFDNASADSGTTPQPWLPVQSVRLDYGTETAGQMSAGFVAVWPTTVPPFNAANAAVVGRSGELVGDRLTRLFLEEGVAFELVGSASDTEPAGPQLIDTLASNAAACEAVDMGLLHGTRHQVGVTYRTRTSIYNQSPVTLDVEAGGEVAPPLEPVIGALGVVNDVTVRRPNGSSARSVAETGPLNVNLPSVDPEGVGPYPVEIEVNADLDDQLQGLADWRRNRGTIKAVRYPQVTVNYGALAADGKTALAEQVNALRIGDRFDLANAEPTDVMQIIPGYTEVIGAAAAQREIVLNGTPANVYEVGVYDAASSRYDSAYSTTAAQITTGTSTSLSVAVEAGRTLWVTGSGSPQFPFDIDLLGARVRVTAISGSSSPQTFTISATVVNGIAKIIPTGTPVRLWSPRRYAL